MKAYTLLTYIALSCFIFSCDNREYYFDTLNEAPKISVNGVESGVVEDSVKMGLKSGSQSYIFNVNYSDINKNIKEITYKLTEANGKVTVDNNAQNGIIPVKELGKTEVKFTPERLGRHIINFTIKDEFDIDGKVELRLTAFQNIGPVANFNVVPIKVLSQYEYKIDASSSFDKDQKFGGGLVRYKYWVNQKEYPEMESSSMMIVFPESGNYLIKVQVQDNDGAWSEVVSRVVSI